MGLDELSLNNYKINYVYKLIQLVNFDYEEYYDNLFKNAIKYGMKPNEFWNNENFKIYYFYEEAYIEKLHEEKHLQGMYNFIALSTVISNALRDSKGGKPLEYPRENLYISQKELLINKQNKKEIPKEKVTKNNINVALQQRLLNCY